MRLRDQNVGGAIVVARKVRHEVLAHLAQFGLREEGGCAGVFVDIVPWFRFGVSIGFGRLLGIYCAEDRGERCGFEDDLHVRVLRMWRMAR